MRNNRLAAICFGGVLTAVMLDCYAWNNRKAFNSGLRFPQWYKLGMQPLVKNVSPETLHSLSVYVASLPRPIRRLLGLVNEVPDDKILATSILGYNFTNPIGVAAGYDKHGEAIDGVFDMGFGFTEIGSVTPVPQPGNPKPRLFRLSEDESVINRYGFNSQGVPTVAIRLKERARRVENQSPSRRSHGILGVNLGKNKETSEEEAGRDYVRGMFALGPDADYVVINISSPNTPGLRNLQKGEKLRGLLKQIMDSRSQVYRNRVEGGTGTGSGPSREKLLPVLVKISPDLDPVECAAIVSECLNARVDGIIVANTTLSRPLTLKSSFADEVGGLSGKAVRDLSTKMIAQVYLMSEGKIPIIGVGGVFTGKDAYDKITAGASLVQLYSSMVFEGPIVVQNVKQGLVDHLTKQGYPAVSAAVGQKASSFIDETQVKLAMKQYKTEK